MPLYRPYATDVRQSKYGYWIVTISVAPDKRMSVMVIPLGITPDQAKELAMGAMSGLPSPRRRQ